MRAMDLVGGTEIISTSDCLELLRAHDIGRVGVVVAGRVEVLPVNYSFDGQDIVIATNDGSKLHGAESGAITLEIDSIDTAAQAGWSVVAHGVVAAVDPCEGPNQLPAPWAGPKDYMIRIRPVAVTGRRASAKFWNRPGD